MARFPTEFLDEVQARSDIVEVISAHIELKKSGRNLLGLCPFHHEKTPSFSVSPEKQLYYCFGCGKGGGVFQFLMENDGLSFHEAVERLAEKAGLSLPDQGEPPTEERRHKQGLAMLAQAAGFFAKALNAPDSGAVRKYLASRGLPQAISEQYSLGFAPPGYGFMSRCFGNEPRTLAQLAYLGLLFKGERGYGDRFRGRLIFPIRDRKGQIVGFGGRLIGDGEPKYLNSPETPYFHKSELLFGLSEHREQIRKRDMMLVVEGYMDVLMLAAHGLPVAVAPLGTAVGESQLRLILRHHSQPVFCFDGDRAGYQAAWRALERMLPLLAAENGPRFLYLPEGEDPDSMVRKEGGEAFAARIEQARPLLETWLLGLKRMAGQGAEGRARMAKKADAMLARMNDDYLRQAWRQEAERTTRIRLAHQAARAPVVRQETKRRLEERFVAALVQQPARLNALPPEAKDFLLDGDPLFDVYTRALQFAAEQQGDIAARLRQCFPDDERIPRWVNEPDVSDRDYEMLLLDMWLRYINHRLPLVRKDRAAHLQLVHCKGQLENRKRSIYKQVNAEE